MSGWLWQALQQVHPRNEVRTDPQPMPSYGKAAEDEPAAGGAESKPSPTGQAK